MFPWILVMDDLLCILEHNYWAMQMAGSFQLKENIVVRGRVHQALKVIKG